MLTSVATITKCNDIVIVGSGALTAVVKQPAKLGKLQVADVISRIDHIPVSPANQSKPG